MRSIFSMNNKPFIILTGFILILCFSIQISAFWMLKSSNATESVSGMDASATTGKIVIENTEVPAKKASRQLERKYRKLIRLEGQEDFLKFTANEMEIAKLFKFEDRHRYGQYYTATIGIDVEKPELLSKARKLIIKREETMQKCMEELEAFFAKADLSCLTDDEYSMFSKYVSDRRKWAEIAYDDSVDNETKLEACKTWADVSQPIKQIVEKIYKTQYGNAFERYNSVFENIGLRKINVYTNPWWINRTSASYRDADGKWHTLRVKLF